MKTKLIVAAGALALLMTGCDQLCQAPKAKTALVTEKEKYSYALGAHFGNQARFQLVTRDSIDLDLEVFIQAFKERYNDDSAAFLMNDSTIFQTLTELSQNRQAEKMKKDSLAAEANKASAAASPTKRDWKSQSPQPEKKRRLSFKERQEYAALEEEIAALEAEKARIEADLCSGTLGAEAITAHARRLPELTARLDADVDARRDALIRSVCRSGVCGSVLALDEVCVGIPVCECGDLHAAFLVLSAG